MKNMGCVRSVFMGVMITCLLFLLMACGGGGDSGSAPGASATITLTSSATSIPADGTSAATITATVVDGNGNAVRHYTDVTFTTTLGHFRNGGTTYTVQTQPPLDSEGRPNPDASPTGIAKVALIAGTTSGSAKVTAYSNNVSQSIYVTFTGAGAVISLAASPLTIPADGTTSTTITATLTDSGGDPVSPGTAVTFSTGLGHFASTALSADEATAAATGSKTVTLNTPDATGVVSLSLIAGLVPGRTYVTATCNEVTQALSVTLTDADASFMAVKAVPAQIPSDGVSTSVVTSTVTDLSGQPLAGVPVTYYHLPSGNEVHSLPPNNTYTGSGSDVTTPFYCNGGILTFTMDFTAKTSESSFIVWLWNADTGERVIQLANETGSVGGNVAVSDPDPGNYFLEVEADGEWSIALSGDIGPGTAVSGQQVVAITTTDSGGQAYYIYTSTLTPEVVIIKAETGEISKSSQALSDTVTITQTAGPPAAITFSTINATYANGNNKTSVSAKVTDQGGNIVDDGTQVVFQVTAGTWAGTGTSQITLSTINGVVTAELTAPVSAASVTSTITGTSGSATGSATVRFVGVWLQDMQADPETIFSDGTDTSTITVRLRDADGIAVQGEEVTFATTLGSLSANRATTDASGIATVTLIAPTATGIATVTATYGLITATTRVTFTDEPVVGNIALTADPATIPADGSSSSTITATITKGDGSAVSKGTSVTFTTSLGTFSNGSQTYTVVTPDETGVVSVALIAGTTTGSAEVTASSTGVSQTIYVGIGGTAISMTLTANPGSIPADGSSSSLITATLKDGDGNPVTPGTSVTFTTTLGTFSNGSTTITTSTQGTSGEASVSLIAAGTEGVATVTAVSSGVSQSLTVGFTGGVGSIDLTADPAIIQADGSSSSTITATLTDTTGNPVTTGTSVTFTTDLGTFSNGSSTLATTTQDSTGVVSVSLISGTTAGTATVTCTSGGVSQNVTVTFTGGEVAKIELTANPATLKADGTSTSTITATVKTADNQLVPGVEVVFSTSRGAITSPHTTDENGQAEATLTSEKYSDPSVEVKAVSQGVEATILVSFTGVTLTLEASPASLLTGEESTVTATLKDGAGNAISNATLTFTTDKGTLTPDTPQLTNASGQAVVQLASTTSGTATVTGTARGATGTESVEFTSYLFRFLTPDPATIRVGGETSQLITELLDNGVPRAGETVYFSSTLGTLNPYNDVTDASGEADTVLTSGTQSGVAVVDAEVTVGGNVLQATTQVVITGGDADKIVLTADPGIIAVNSGVTTLTATVYDANDQPAPGQDIYFRINAGPGGGEYLSASVKTTNSSGVAVVYLYAGSLSSTLDGVEIEANTQPDFSGSFGLAYVTIAGPVANIGVGMNLETLEPSGGDLMIDISGIATDVNGNPVADGTKIYFSVTAIEFDEDRANDLTINCWDDNKNPLIPCPPVGTSGFGFTWFSDDVNQDGTMYSLGGPMSTTEDVDHNGILDPGEDKNDNGIIDPIQGCTIDDSVETEDGVADATLIYPAPQANNIKVRITASAGGVSNFYETILLCTETMVENGTCGIGY